MADAIAQDQPRTVAVIDIGTTAMRMAVGQVKPDGTVEVLERLRQPVRLGHSTFMTGRLSPKMMNTAIAVLRDYRAVCDTYKVSKVRAVATSAVREAGNSDSFLDRAMTASGFDIEIIEPAEESRLTVLAVRHSLRGGLDINHGTVLVVHIGGGSGLLTVLKDGVIAGTESYNLGAVRLQASLGTAEEPPRRAATLLKRHIDGFTSAIQRTMPIEDVDTYIAAGGDARLAASQFGRTLAGLEARSVSAKDLNDWVEQCAEKTPMELGRMYGISPSEAENLTPALLAHLALLEASGSKEMIVSEVSMRDGLILDLTRSLSGKEDPESIAGTIQSAEAVGEKYQYDASHGRQVAQMAVQLFDALQAVHRLPVHARLLLQVAALLHEVGGFVSSRAHHKHSYYLISNASILGLRPYEQEIVALVARYHRRSGPRLSHPPYAALTHDHRIIVTKLAAILRIADALDRAHLEKVRQFHVSCNPTHCVITVADGPDLTLERKAMDRKADLFEDAFGMKVRIEAQEDGPDAGPVPASNGSGLA